MCCMFQLPKGRWVSGGCCCTWGRSLSDASRQLLLSWWPGVDFFIQIAINEFSKFIAEHFQVGLGIRWAVVLKSIYVHGVKGLEGSIETASEPCLAQLLWDVISYISSFS
jgi:hypothetical protein